MSETKNKFTENVITEICNEVVSHNEVLTDLAYGSTPREEAPKPLFRSVELLPYGENSLHHITVRETPSALFDALPDSTKAEFMTRAFKRMKDGEKLDIFKALVTEIKVALNEALADAGYPQVSFEFTDGANRTTLCSFGFSGHKTSLAQQEKVATQQRVRAANRALQSVQARKAGAEVYSG